MIGKIQEYFNSRRGIKFRPQKYEPMIAEGELHLPKIT